MPPARRHAGARKSAPPRGVALKQEPPACSNKALISAAPRCSSVPKQIAENDPPIQVHAATCSKAAQLD